MPVKVKGSVFAHVLSDDEGNNRQDEDKGLT